MDAPQPSAITPAMTISATSGDADMDQLLLGFTRHKSGDLDALRTAAVTLRDTLRQVQLASADPSRWTRP
ncbi:hypothetical protein TPB0596_20340 [Tsukamurella pulmonis]|uniref:hypothetical protein n=1 Tax=Tsukamurella pulmonis TaxID=47312 RepID=UPI001EE0DAB6|nr:hypothetical protein [Tsukamurella pulmonis]BDD82271.1 hypothetical protein TPB0596_20340 [Tsukamurella pulmonis]